MSPTPSRQQRILIIEDEPDIAKVIGAQVRRWGYEVMTASSGEEGLRLARANVPDLILLDVLMPQMKGREVCAHLKAHRATERVPVIFLTALGMPDHIKAGLDLGAEDYIIKPFKPEELRQRIKLCLFRAAQPPEPPTVTPS